ncbi:MAG: ankyrin repeat domain-containing protein [Bryobacteraceae bacterium]
MLRCCALFVPVCVVALVSAAGEDPGSAALADHFTRLIRANDLDGLRRLAAGSAAVNTEDKLHNRPLHYAAIYGSADSVRILLDAAADPNARNQPGATPLVYAAWNFEKTRLLVEKGAQVNVATRTGVTPLMVAVSAHGNIATVRYLIDHGADVHAVDELSTDALIRAAFQSDPEVIEALLGKGADPHHADKAGFTALQGALSFSDSERVRLLLSAGSDPNASNIFGGQVKHGPLALVHLTPLMLAAPYGQLDTVSILVKAGGRVNDLDIRKMNALTLAIATDHANPETVRQLIAAGADVNAKDQNGESVLDWARKFRNPEIMTALEEKGAKGGQFDPSPQPPPHSQPQDASEAIHRALPLMARSGPVFFREGGGCAGCHHQPMQARAFAAVKACGMAADPALKQSFADAMVAVRPRLVPILPLLTGPGGDFDSLLAPMMAYADLHLPADGLTDLMVHYIAVRQDPSGAWIMLGIARPPLEDSTIVRTAMAIRTLQTYGWPARQAEFDERISRGRRWLQNAKPVTTYEHADRIMGLRAAGVPASDLRTDAQALTNLQRKDGGWAQTRFLESDAYATGLVLYTLYTTGLLGPNDPAYRKGVAFLLETQFPDGSWYVRSRAPKFQPYFQSGFPFAHDQWISSTATSWAVMALAPASESATSSVANAERH